MKKIFITDWYDKFGGAEKVVQAINEIYDFDIYLSYANVMPKDIQKDILSKDVKVESSLILKILGRHFRLMMPLFPVITFLFNRKYKNKNVAIIISSSWALSKSLKIKGAKHFCYLQARNFKYVWEESNQYFTGAKKFLSFTKKYLQKYDIKTAQNPDFLISNSRFVQQWVKTHYKRDSIVIYPPVDIDNFEISNNKQDYYITIGRLEPYKRFDVIIEAFKKNGKKLIVVGDGSMRKDLENKSLSNITFVGYKNKIEVSSLLRKAQAFIYAGIEDFGIVYIEALASGVPIIGYNGGALPEIIEDGKEGYLYSQQSVDELNMSIEKFCKFGVLLTPQEIREKSKRFSKEVFQQKFEKFITKNS